MPKPRAKKPISDGITKEEMMRVVAGERAAGMAKPVGKDEVLETIFSTEEYTQAARRGADKEELMKIATLKLDEILDDPEYQAAQMQEIEGLPDAGLRRLPPTPEVWCITWHANDVHDADAGDRMFSISNMIIGPDHSPYFEMIVGHDFWAQKDAARKSTPPFEEAEKILRNSMTSPGCNLGGGIGVPRRPAFVLVQHRWGGESFARLARWLRGLGIGAKWETRAEAEQVCAMHGTDPDGFDFKPLGTRKPLVCTACGREGKMLKCKGCEEVQYCGNACQKAHWKEHKGQCGRACTACGKEGKTLKCMGCEEVQYCGSECQKAHWKEHKVQCRASEKAKARKKT